MPPSATDVKPRGRPTPARAIHTRPQDDVPHIKSIAIFPKHPAPRPQMEQPETPAIPPAASSRSAPSKQSRSPSTPTSASAASGCRHIQIAPTNPTRNTHFIARCTRYAAGPAQQQRQHARHTADHPAGREAPAAAKYPTSPASMRVRPTPAAAASSAHRAAEIQISFTRSRTPPHHDRPHQVELLFHAQAPQVRKGRLRHRVCRGLGE